MKGIRQAHEHLKDRVNVVMPLEKKWYGPTEFAFTDPDGYVITFAETEAERMNIRVLAVALVAALVVGGAALVFWPERTQPAVTAPASEAAAGSIDQHRGKGRGLVGSGRRVGSGW